MKVFCIGRNYSDHIKELDNKFPENPVFFMKADTAIVTNNRPFFYPSFSSEIHYELELVIRICKVGKSINEKYAHTYWNEIAVGIDFTARDLQKKQSEKGLPWEIAKSFDNSAPVSKFIPKTSLLNPDNINFRLELNKKTVQNGFSENMIYSFDKIISYLSNFFTLKHGDIIFTGTPSGVGPVKPEDVLEAYLEDTKMLLCRIK